jgi:uncharacterized DUF497 family protein
VEIIWDEAKNELLKKERKVSFEEARDIIDQYQELAIIDNPVRQGQLYYIVKLNNYTHVVPALIDENEKLVLKTIFPSRKFDKIYGGKKDAQN